MDATAKRVCKCGEEYVKRRKKDKSLCPKCLKADFDAYRAANPEKMRAYARKGHKRWKAKDPEAVRAVSRRTAQRISERIRNGQGTVRQILALQFYRMKKEARRRDVLILGVTVETLMALWEAQQGKCALSGLPMAIATRRLTTVSVDRRDSKGHYSPDNIQLVCRWVNMGKNQHSDAEMLEVIRSLRENPS